MKIAEWLGITLSALSIIIASISIWTVGTKVLKRLAIIQNRLSSLKALYISLQLRQSDSEEYLVVKHGYHKRNYSVEMERALIQEYESEDTGF